MGDIYGVGMEGYGVGMEGYGLGRLKGLSMRREWMGEKGGHPQVLVMGPSNLYANGAVVILAEKGHFDVAKDVVTQALYHKPLSNKLLDLVVKLLATILMAFMRKKIETHVEYCEHLLDAAKVHCEAAEREEQQNRQRLEVARQLERRKQEDELERVMQQEEHFERIRTRKVEVVKGGERKAEKGGGRIRGRTFYENEEGFIDDEQEEMEEEDAKQLSGQAEEKDKAHDHLAAAGLEENNVE
ncbi:hypothetical protein HPP92_012555 [Vanilla planifolia]|uniref:Uncharacterized protein n=1 Tax=Vanilla planifolia TaxID=51239 RepID=A0A835R800_VANPL|nr:hypothetical protein HPP92_012555 [Vanilla planifolia]